MELKNEATNELKTEKQEETTNNSSGVKRSNNHHESTHQSKKRPKQTARVSANDRLCHSVEKGTPCPWPDSCKYAHDPFLILNGKPEDIGPVCYQYDVFGYCPNGIMCRFATSHIDRTTGKNLTRSIENGGVKERININVLCKELQNMLRKKKFAGAYVPIKKPIIKIMGGPFESSTISSTDLSTTNTIADDNDIDKSTSDNIIKNETNQLSTQITINDNNINNSYDTNTMTADSSTLTNSNIAPSDTNTSIETATTTAPVVVAAPVPVAVTSNKVKLENLSAYDHKVKLVDFSNKVYVAPLTTVGNLPFRRILKDFGADITCGEMAMAQNLEQGQSSEWALLRRHTSEDIFGIQIASHHIDQTARMAKILENETSTDFVDLNCGCPIDVVCNRGCGAALLQRPGKLSELVGVMTKHLNRSVTIKIRTGWNDKEPMAHKLIPHLQKISHGKIAAVMIHGRSRLQRYSKAANWDYILETARSQDSNYPYIPIIGNGDILTWTDWHQHQSLLTTHFQEIQNKSKEIDIVHVGTNDIVNTDIDTKELLGLTSCAMIGRGALMKPWLSKEIKESRHYDISATERLDIIKNFCNYGLEHWGSDQQGVNTTRRFLLEWLSFACRYVPCGVLDHNYIQKMQDRPPAFVCRNELESLLSSNNCQDWIKLSSIFLGPVPENFKFEPKHKSSSYSNGVQSRSDSGHKTDVVEIHNNNNDNIVDDDFEANG